MINKMIKPKAIKKEYWDKLKRKYSELSLNSWEHLDGLKKNTLLRNANIKLDNKILFGEDYILNYPEDIYLKTKKIILHPTTLNTIRHMAIDEIKEIGGIINNNKIDVLFSGNKNRIKLDLNKKTQTLFHTHPADDDLDFDPPSVLDIVSFLALNVQSIAEYILNGKKDVRKLLKVENSMVFTKDEVYVYYISYPLIKNITEYLIDLNEKQDLYQQFDFIYNVEKLLEELELYYSNILSRFNMTLDEKLLNEYIEYLSKLGIIMKRFKYTDKPEVYVM